MRALVTLLDRDGDNVGVAEYDSEARSIRWVVPPGLPDLVLAAVRMPDGGVAPMVVPRSVVPGDTVVIRING